MEEYCYYQNVQCAILKNPGFIKEVEASGFKD